MSSRPWTSEEDQWLLDHYSVNNAMQAARELDRTMTAIYHRASRLGLAHAVRPVATSDPHELRRCQSCEANKPLGDFSQARGRYTWRCKVCVNALPHPSKQQWRVYTRRYRYGLEPAAYQALVGDGRCDICSQLGEEIDHDHQSGKIRGYLCKQCNRGLGHFRDDPNLLQKAIEYL